MTNDTTSPPPLDPNRWVEEHGDALYRYAILRLRNAELAEDAVQETFFAALRGLESFRGGSSERTWLVGILKRKIFDHFRRRYREQPVSQLAAEEEEDGGFSDFFTRLGHWKTGVEPWTGNPRETLKQKEFQAVLRRCLGALPGRQGEAFILREIEQLDSEEICQALSITPTNLWAILHRARVRLRGCLTKNWFGGGARN